MAKYTVSQVKELRDETDAGMMDCKKALEEADGDYNKALAIVKERGLAKADKKADRETTEGYLGNYIHSNGKVGALVQLLCETDFVARNEDFRVVANEIAMQITAMMPENVDELLAQDAIKRDGMTIEMMVKELSAKVGERVVVGPFHRFQIGE